MCPDASLASASGVRCSLTLWNDSVIYYSARNFSGSTQKIRDGSNRGLSFPASTYPTGHTIQISHSKLFNGLEIVVKKSKAFKLTRAYRNGKGTRLNLDKEELEAQGGSFWDVLRNAGNWIKNHIIDTPIYQNDIKPIVRQVVNSGVNALSAAVGSEAPMLAPVVNSLGNSAVNAIGSKTGAFGLKPRRGMGGSLRGTAFDPALPMPPPGEPHVRMEKVRRERRHRSRVGMSCGGKLVKGSAAAKEWGGSDESIESC